MCKVAQSSGSHIFIRTLCPHNHHWWLSCWAAAAAAAVVGSVWTRATIPQPFPRERLFCNECCWTSRRYHQNEKKPGGRVIFEHGLVVVGEHLLQRARHRVAPEQIVVQSAVCVKPGRMSIVEKKLHLRLTSYLSPMVQLLLFIFDFQKRTDWPKNVHLYTSC